MNSIELVAKAMALGIEFPELPSNAYEPYNVNCLGVDCVADFCPFNAKAKCLASTAARDAQDRGAPLQDPEYFKQLYPEYFL